MAAVHVATNTFPPFPTLQVMARHGLAAGEVEGLQSSAVAFGGAVARLAERRGWPAIAAVVALAAQRVKAPTPLYRIQPKSSRSNVSTFSRSFNTSRFQYAIFHIHIGIRMFQLDLQIWGKYILVFEITDTGFWEKRNETRHDIYKGAE